MRKTKWSKKRRDAYKERYLRGSAKHPFYLAMLLCLICSPVFAQTVQERLDDGIPTNAGNAAITPAKGSVWVANGTAFTPLAAGTDGYVLSADSSKTSGLAWIVAGGGGGSAPFSDVTGLVYNAADITKIGRFSAASISSATTRVYTLPDVNGTMVTTGDTASVATAMLANAAVTAVKMVNAGVETGDSTATFPAITVTKTNGVAFAASATTDTTSASNISAGTLAIARFPSITNHALIVGSGAAGSPTILAVGATNQFLVGNTGADPSWTAYAASATTDTTNAANITSGTLPAARIGAASIDLTAKVTGVLPPANGGTGVANAKNLTVSNALTLAGTDSTTMTFPSTSATIARTDAANTFTGHQTIEGVTSTGATGTGNLVFASTPTLSTPVLTGLPTGSGVASAATASTLAARDASANLSSNSFVPGYTTTVTAGGATTLTVSSTMTQFFTGTNNQTVILPVESTLALGQQFLIVNNSTLNVIVDSSGSNNILILNGGESGLYTCVSTSLTTAAAWNASVCGATAQTGSGSLVFATSPMLITPVLGTPTSGTLTNCTGLPANGVLPQTINAQSGTTYTFVAGDAQEIVTGSNGGATTYSIPTNATTAFAVNTQIVVIQTGAGAITIQASNSGTTTITSAGATSAAPIINAQYCACVCLKTATDTWIVFGNIK